MVANLLHDVGVSVHTAYGCSQSTASFSLIVPALQNMFGFNLCNLEYRTYYSDSLWINMLKGELDERRPVIYGGVSLPGKGHRFVIDGYNQDNLFHVNFGWGGHLNGFYTLDGIEYFSAQSMIMNIHPNYPQCTSLTIPNTDIWDNNFKIINGGEITIGDRTVTNGMRGIIMSGESVTLTSDFEVELGAEVYINVQDMHCDEDRGNIDEQTNNQEEVYHMQQKVSEANDTPTATKLLREGQIHFLRDGKIFTITGQRVK